MYFIIFHCRVFLFAVGECRKNTSPPSQLIAKCRCFGRCQDAERHSTLVLCVYVLETSFDIVKSWSEFIFWRPFRLQFPELGNNFRCSEAVPWAASRITNGRLACRPTEKASNMELSLKQNGTNKSLRLLTATTVSAQFTLIDFTIFQSMVWSIQMYEKAAANSSFWVHWMHFASACNTCCCLVCQENGIFSLLEPRMEW